jgi:hypothetical protein
MGEDSHETFERIIEQDGNPLYRVAYPVEYKGNEFLVIQKRKRWQEDWRGGVWIRIDDDDDVEMCKEISEGIIQVLQAGLWDMFTDP